MTHVRYTLLTDGASDDLLLHPIDWLITDLGIVTADGQWADLRVAQRPPRSLVDRIRLALFLYPCDLLFVHRDAESVPHADRIREIEGAFVDVDGKPPHVCIVPVRMTEAWLLHDEAAIRWAADNPNGTMPLPHLPAAGEAEGLTDPKQVLGEALVVATGAVGQRRHRVQRRVGHMRRAVPQHIEDYSPLRQLPAFQAFERELRAALQDLLGSGPD